MHMKQRLTYTFPSTYPPLYMFHKTLSIITSLLLIISRLQSSSLPFSIYLCLSLSLYQLTKMTKSGSEQESYHTPDEVESAQTSGGRDHSASEKGKTPVIEAPLIGKGDRDVKVKVAAAGAGVKRGVGIMDFLVRLLAIAAALAATVAMGTTQQTLPFFTQFFQFQAQYNDLPTFTYFVIANAITAAYLVLSLPFSVVTIVRPLPKAPRLLLITFDAMAMTLTTSAAGAAAAIVYLAHKGNTNTNWIAICQQFDNFCQRTSGAVVASFIAVALFILLVILSAVALKNH